MSGVAPRRLNETSRTTTIHHLPGGNPVSSDTTANPNRMSRIGRSVGRGLTNTLSTLGEAMAEAQRVEATPDSLTVEYLNSDGFVVRDNRFGLRLSRPSLIAEYLIEELATTYQATRVRINVLNYANRELETVTLSKARALTNLGPVLDALLAEGV